MAGPTVAAFTDTEHQRAYKLLASKVATMGGRKLEEDDWNSVYLQTKRFPESGWSNTDLDINHEGLGVESKLLKSTRKGGVSSYFGDTIMHPAGTRAVDTPEYGFGNGDADEAAHFMVQEYADYIRRRQNEVRENSSDGEADLRLSLLIWEEDLSEFIYFERRWTPPDPDDFYGEWSHNPRSSSKRQSSTSLHVYREANDEKRYSVTDPSKGVKVQPYIDVPEEDSDHLYHFVAQGETPGASMKRRVWAPPTLDTYLKTKLGDDVDGEMLSNKIYEFADRVSSGEIDLSSDDGVESISIAEPFDITQEAYSILQELSEASDTDALRLVARKLERNQTGT